MSETTKMYNNSVTLHFNEHARNRYTIEETKQSPVGVTSVLSAVLNKPALMLWPLNEAVKKLTPEIGQPLTEELLETAKKAYLVKGDKGKDTGTLIHAAVEAYLKGEPMDITPEIEKPLEAFGAWFDSVDPKVLSVEKVCYSRKYNYAGKFDAILEIDGQIVMVDWKSSNSSRTAPKGVYLENFMQLGAYNLAYREEKATRLKPGIDFSKQYPTDLMVVRIGKDGVLNTLKASELNLTVKDCEDKFLEVLSLYRFITPNVKKISELK